MNLFTKHISSFIPFLQVVKEYSRKKFFSDLIAGFIGAILVLPQGVAFATIAGLPPEYGLYTAIVPAIIAALFGSSFHLISGPTTAISLVVFSTISPLAAVGSPEYIQLVLTLTFVAGLFQLLMGIFHLGTLTNFVSHSVVVGFTAGAAILIAASQLKNVFGIDISQADSFYHTIKELILHIQEINIYALIIALTTLLIAIYFKKITTKIPAILVAMIAGSVLAFIFDADAHHIRLVGALPRSLPPLSTPDLHFHTLQNMVAPAAAVALLGLTEAVSIARSIATRSNQRINGNQEFIGQGLSNIIGSFFSSYASSGSFTRSGLNYQSGAKTPFAGVFAAILLALIILLIAPLTAYLPIASMAGILLLVAYKLIDMHHIKKIFQVSKAETIVLIATFCATLFLNLEFAIYVGVFLSLVLYLQRTSKPHIYFLTPDSDQPKQRLVKINSKSHLQECPQLKFLKIDGSIFFGAASHVSDMLGKINEQHKGNLKLLIVADTIRFIDIAGAEMLVAEIQSWRKNGNDIFFSGISDEVYAILQKGGYLKTIGKDHLFSSKVEAIKEIYTQCDKAICKKCTKRIFYECKQ
ncbi:MAG TPA: SulP family inorganic anion transporter [Patescibacteria group bacterium]|nr:SulP family inorganic anion transporter [Patescibacteria group bacterium]